MLYFNQHVVYYTICNIYGFRFHTKNCEMHYKTINSGAVVNKVHEGRNVDFYGILTDITELDYGQNRVPHI